MAKALFEVVRFPSTDGIQLSGLLSMPRRTKGVGIYMHGLAGGAFSQLGTTLAKYLNTAGYGLFIINTRGAGIVTSFKQEDKKKPSGFRYITAGTAYETFTECGHDIQGAVNVLKERGHQKLFLVGSSTGCQKSIYYLAQRGSQRHIAGVALLAPVSDYAVYRKEHGKQLEAMTLLAKTFIKNKKGDTFMPPEMTDFLLTAKRFYSLISPKSAEEIFTYATGKKPKTLQTVKTPTFVAIGDQDEYLDRPVLELVEWFEENIMAKKKQVEWIEGADHGFGKKEKQLSARMVEWLQMLQR